MHQNTHFYVLFPSGWENPTKKKSVFNALGQGNGVKGRQKFRAMTLPESFLLCWEPKPQGNSSKTGIHTRCCLLTLWHSHYESWAGNLSNTSWGQLSNQARSQSRKNFPEHKRKQLWSKQGEKTHPKSAPCSFPGIFSVSVRLTLMPEARFHLQTPRDLKHKPLLFC